MRAGLVLLLVLVMAPAVAAGEAELSLDSPLEIEAFLKAAEIVDFERFETKGITKPQKAILSDGKHTAAAVFKTIDKYHSRVKLTTGKTALGLKDSYKHEIAAYELSKLLGLEIVPPAVERTIHRRTGSLSFWVEGAMTEYQRSRVKKLRAPDVVAWNQQMMVVRLFMQLTWDTDFNNINNLLIDPEWKIWKIDSSRAFRNSPDLRREGTLDKFSRKALAALRDLTRDQLDERLGPWLDKKQLDGLWARRLRILELAAERVSELGEGPVLYP